MMNNSLAVLITYYNEKELLEECLRSLAVQSVLPDEVWVYDDCARFPAKDYVPQDLPFEVQLVRGEVNRKPAFGRNFLMQKTSCEYIHCHDADDLFEPDFCEKIKTKITESASDIILHETRIVRGGQTTAIDNFFGRIKVKDLEHLIKIAIGGAILPANITYKRHLALETGGYLLADVLPQSEDYEFHIRLLHAAKTYAIFYEPLTVQRIRADSHSSSNQEKVYASGVTAIRILSQLLPPEYHQDLGARAATFGMVLYRMGEKAEARNAFQLARQLKTKYEGRSFLYRRIALYLGQELAENFSHCLQKLKKAKLIFQEKRVLKST